MNSESKHTVNWHGPAIKGKIITTGWDPETLTPPMSWKDDEDGGKLDSTATKSVLDGREQIVKDEL